jgi:hypothetical protein
VGDKGTYSERKAPCGCKGLPEGQHLPGCERHRTGAPFGPGNSPLGPPEVTYGPVTDAARYARQVAARLDRLAHFARDDLRLAQKYGEVVKSEHHKARAEALAEAAALVRKELL